MTASQLYSGMIYGYGLQESYINDYLCSSNNVSGGETKVTNLYVIVWWQENVDRLQVSVYHTLNIKPSIADWLYTPYKFHQHKWHLNVNQFNYWISTNSCMPASQIIRHWNSFVRLLTILQSLNH